MNSSANDTLPKQRACIAELMDSHPELFPPPVAGGAWTDAIVHPGEVAAADRPILDRALGMVSGIYRAAQFSFGDSLALSDMIAREESGTLAELPCDPALMNWASGSADDDEAVMLAKGVTAYKYAVNCGFVDVDALQRMLAFSIERLPGDSALTQNLKRAALSLADIALGQVLRRIPEDCHE